MKRIPTLPTVGCRVSSAGYSKTLGSVIFALQPGWLCSRLNWQLAILRNAAGLPPPTVSFPIQICKIGPLGLKHFLMKTGFLHPSDTSCSPPKLSSPWEQKRAERRSTQRNPPYGL
jgi:hypothetical protein